LVDHVYDAVGSHQVYGREHGRRVEPHRIAPAHPTTISISTSVSVIGVQVAAAREVDAVAERVERVRGRLDRCRADHVTDHVMQQQICHTHAHTHTMSTKQRHSTSLVLVSALTLLAGRQEGHPACKN